MAPSLAQDLRALARLYNVQVSFYDVFGRHTYASEEGLMQVLRALGAPLERIDDIPDALRERRQSLYRRLADPVLVMWDGKPKEFKIRLPASLAEEPVRYEIDLESGESLGGTSPTRPLRNAKGVEIDGVRYESRHVTLPVALPLGYHQCRLEIKQQSGEILLISAPMRAHGTGKQAHKSWGVFLPLYALQSETSWGAGDFSDLERLVDWVGRLGGGVVGTLPLLAAFLDTPFDASPYAPASRLFWNEFYLDITRLAEFSRCPVAQALVQSADFQTEIEALRSAPLVDYSREMMLKRRVLEELCRFLFREQSARYQDFQRFVETHPQAEDYARFRAAMERHRRPWMDWPEAERDGTIKPGDYEADAMRYHLYAQWSAEEQIQKLAEKTKAGGAELYLDFPLGVHRDGYDVWRERGAFALEISGGAPPDTFFTKGQNWGFPPFHPERLRMTGYRHYINCLRHHLRHAGRLRIDHVMGMHRLYWVPEGMEADQGVYVHYQAEEFYAILSLESHRHKALVIGENLGTVPEYVNAAMAEHNIFGMHVGQFGVRPDPNDALEDMSVATVASLNTHDTPPFASFWDGTDIPDRMELGLLDDREADNERSSRCLQRDALIGFLRKRNWIGEESPQAGAVLKAWLLHLADGPAELLLVNLEDLWLESRPQNVPATWQDRPNWRRKATYRLKAFSQMSEVVDVLRAIDDQRKRAR